MQKQLKISFALLACLVVVGSLSHLSTGKHLNTRETQYKLSDSEHDHETRGHNHSFYQPDILEGSGAIGYFHEEDLSNINNPNQPKNASVSNSGSCNTITSSHGPGRENGYQTGYLDIGCGNYASISYNYGTTNIPFFVDVSTMSPSLANTIRDQAEMWNQSVIHDGTDTLVNLYEVNHTNNINGRPVVVIRSATLDPGTAGHFIPNKNSPMIEINTSHNIDTPVHEMGHLLGLNDLDPLCSVPSGTHKALMGYARGTNATTLSTTIKYQDIQGVARVNSTVHTQHQFSAYTMHGSKYVHFCFFCDTVDSRSSALQGSSSLLTASTCYHDYKKMISHGEREWIKCLKCYKVIETKKVGYDVITSGIITVPRSSDMFKFVAPIDGSFTFSSFQSINAYARLFDSNLNFLSYDISGDPMNFLFYRDMSRGEVVYLHVESNYSNLAGYYNFKISTNVATLSMSSPVSGVINSSVGFTWCRFIVPMNGLYSFYSTNSLNAYAALYDDNGILLQSDISGDPMNFLIRINLTAAQSVFLKVSGHYSYVTGYFTANVKTDTIIPTDYGFDSQYYFEEKEALIVYGESEFNSKRLRCGYIYDSSTKNSYLALSANRKNAGTAYLEYSFDSDIAGLELNIALWSASENITDNSADIRLEYLDGNDVWSQLYDFSIASMSKSKDVLDNHLFSFETPVRRFRIFITTTNTGGDNNKGRVVLGDINVLFL